MSFKWLGSLSQLRIGIPLKKTTKWADQLESDAWMKIVEHDHSGTDGKGVKLGANSISDNSISTNKIQDNAVTTAKVPNKAITTAKINDAAITDVQLASDSVITSKILDSNITTTKINDSAVTTAKINDKAVTSAKLADNITIVDSLTAPEIDATSLMASNLITIPRALPIEATEGEIAVSDGTGYNKGVYLYQDAEWVSVQGEVGADSVNTNAIQDTAVTTSKLAVGAALGNIVDNTIPKSKLVDSVLSVYNYSSDQSKTISPGVTVDLTFSDINNDTLNITSNIITFKKQGYYRVVLNLGYTLSSGVFTNPTNYTITALGTGSSSDSQIKNAARVSHTVTGGSGVTLPTSSMDVVTSMINTTLRYTLLVSWSPGIATHNTLNFRPILTIIYLGI